MTDAEQIQQLLARFCFVADTGTAEELTDLFWDDAVLDSSSPFIGRDAILQANRDWIKKMRDPVVGLRHLIFTPLIKIDGTRASAECYFNADGHSKKRKTAIGLRGTYKDILEKRDGVWKILRRETTLFQPLHKELA